MAVGVVVPVVAVVLVSVIVVSMAVVVMAAAAPPTMLVGMVMGGTVVRILVLVPVVVAAIGPVLVISAALGPERPLDQARCRPEPARHLHQHVVVPDIDRVGRDLGRYMPISDMPGDLHEPQRVFGPDFDELLGRSLDLHETAVLKLNRVAVVEHDRLIQVEKKRQPAIRRERHAAAVASLMVERQGVGDAIRLHGRAADDGGGTQHKGPVSVPGAV